jgi:hypothetical protein
MPFVSRPFGPKNMGRPEFSWLISRAADRRPRTSHAHHHEQPVRGGVQHHRPEPACAMWGVALTRLSTRRVSESRRNPATAPATRGVAGVRTRRRSLAVGARGGGQRARMCLRGVRARLELTEPGTSHRRSSSHRQGQLARSIRPSLRNAGECTRFGGPPRMANVPRPAATHDGPRRRPPCAGEVRSPARGVRRVIPIRTWVTTSWRRRRCWRSATCCGLMANVAFDRTLHALRLRLITAGLRG